MFVLLTVTIPRSFYLAEYEMLTGGPNYWVTPFLGRDSVRNRPLKLWSGQLSMTAFPHMHVTNIPRH